MVTPSSDNSIQCPSCGALSPEDKIFCGDCGVRLDPVLGTVKTYLDANLKDRVDGVLKDRFRDKDLIEAQSALNVTDRVLGWGKTVAKFVLIPGTLLAVVAGIFGIHTVYEFFARLASGAQNAVDAQRFDAQKAITNQAATAAAMITDQETNARETITRQQALATQELAKDTSDAKITGQSLADLQATVSALKNNLAATQATVATTETALRATQSAVAVIKTAQDGQAAETLEMARKTNKASGIDISSQNIMLDLTGIKSAGISFAYIKASEGGERREGTFVKELEAAKAAGLLHGAYHFWHSEIDAAAQASLFLDILKRTQAPGDLPPAVDYEIAVNNSPGELAKFLQLVEGGTGCKPIIYTTRGFATSNSLLLQGLGGYPLWTAQFNVPAPAIFPPWETWTFWQYTQSFGINGIRYDLDLFNGSVDDLQKFAKTSCRGTAAH